MSYIGIMKQANLADKIGNYRLADVLTNKLLKYAKESVVEIILKAADLKKALSRTGPRATDIRRLATQSAGNLIKLFENEATKPEAIRIIGELNLKPRDRQVLMQRLNSKNPETSAKALDQLETLFSARYEAQKAAGFVDDGPGPKPEDGPKPPDGPRPPEGPKPEDGPISTVTIEEIVKNHKGTPEQLKAKLMDLGFSKDEIDASNIISPDGKINFVNVNKLVNNVAPERIVELNSSSIIYGGRIINLGKIPYELLIDLLRKPDVNTADQAKIINKIKIQLRKDPNLVVPEDLRKYFDEQFWSPRPKPDPTKPDPSAPTTPGSTADEAVEAVSNPGKKPWLAWAAMIGIPALLAYGWTVYNGTIVHKDTGKPVTDEEGNAAMNSAGAGAGSQFKSKSDMYEQRMRTTPNQQMMKGNKPQEFVDANKGKFKTQREFYDAALAAVDKNFANSVVALVKKDLDLPVSAEDQRKF